MQTGFPINAITCDIPCPGLILPFSVTGRFPALPESMISQAPASALNT